MLKEIKSNTNPEGWEALLSFAINGRCVYAEDFLNTVDIHDVFDSEEDFYDQISSDEETVFFTFSVEGNELAGMRYSGEFILFSKDGEMPCEIDDVEPKRNLADYHSDSLSWVLFEENSPLVKIKAGEEILKWETFKAKCYIGVNTNSFRYQLKNTEQEVIAGIFISDSVIDTIFTSINDRRNSLGRRLLAIAKNDIPTLRHSDVHTDIGRDFIASTPLDDVSF